MVRKLMLTFFLTTSLSMTISSSQNHLHQKKLSQLESQIQDEAIRLKILTWKNDFCLFRKHITDQLRPYLPTVIAWFIQKADNRCKQNLIKFRQAIPHFNRLIEEKQQLEASKPCRCKTDGPQRKNYR